MTSPSATPQRRAATAPIGVLEPGDTVAFSCTHTGVLADFVNIATVSALDLADTPIQTSDSANVTVLVPAIEVQKTPETQLVVTGGTATFTITVINSGEADLSGVIVSDPAAPGCDLTIGSLPVGATHAYTCVSEVLICRPAEYGCRSPDLDPLGAAYTDSDTASVDVIAPQIGIDITPDTQTVTEHGTAVFTVTVVNNGDATLTGVVITNTTVAGCAQTIPSLAPGETFSYPVPARRCHVDFPTTVDVTATDPLGGTVTAADTANVNVLVPGISITKSPADPGRGLWRRGDVRHRGHQYGRDGPDRCHRLRSPHTDLRSGHRLDGAG